MMKALICFVLMLCGSAFVIAQDTLSCWRFGGGGSLVYSYRSLKATDELTEMKVIYDSIETGILGFQFGGIVEFALNRSFDVVSGIDYVRMGYDIDTLKEASITDMRFRYDFIRVPLKFVWHYQRGMRMSPFLSIGGGANYCVSEKVTFKQFGSATLLEMEKKTVSGKVFPELNCSVGMVKQITPETMLRIFIEAHYNLNSLEAGNLSRKLWGTGVSVSLSHRF